MAKSNGFVLPRDDEHTLIVGMNGSGKTQLGAFLLSKQDLKNRRWIIIDYKGDELLNSLERTREIGFEVPNKNGLYIIHLMPSQNDDVDKWLWSVWGAENVGVYVDEGYMLPQGRRPGEGAFDTIQVQGRSKRIPVITLTQRPVQISRFAISEASHVAYLRLNDRRDLETLTNIVPRDFPTWTPPEFTKNQVGDATSAGLPAYHTRWYSVKSDRRFVLRPVPDAETIRADIDRQLEPKVRWF